MFANVAVSVRERGRERHVGRTHNTTCVGYHRLLVRLADPEDGLTHDDVDFHLDVGEAESADPAYSDTEIAAQVARIDITDFVNEGTNLYTTTFLGSNEANPDGSSAHQSIWNIGVVAEVESEDAEYLCNHSTIPEIQKDQSTTATIEATLELNDDPDDA